MCVYGSRMRRLHGLVLDGVRYPRIRGWYLCVYCNKTFIYEPRDSSMGSRSKAIQQRQ